ncbi:MAG: fibronectin type III domain-containing protein [Firmicutes bacterium]|nr:fibronectin type III domain-containing protein [Bacillota bacterium]
MKSITISKISKILIIAVFVTMCFGIMTVGQVSAASDEVVLKVTTEDDGNFYISLTKLPADRKYVEIDKSSDGGSTWAPLEGKLWEYKEVKGKKLVDKNVKFDKTYKYHVYMFNIDEEGNNIDEISSNYVTIKGSTAKLPEFTDSKATGNVATQVTLKWTKVPGVDGYKIYKYNTDTKKYVLKKTVKGAKTTSADITKLPKNKKATFKIAAYKGSVIGPKSDSISEKPCPNEFINPMSEKITSYPKGQLSLGFKRVYYNSKNKVCVKALAVNRRSSKVNKIYNYTLQVKHKGVLIAKYTFSKTLNLEKNSKKWVTFTFTEGTKKSDRNLRYGAVEIHVASYNLS